MFKILITKFTFADLKLCKSQLYYLHSSMELVLRASYNSGFKKNRVGTNVEKALQQLQRRKVQKLFWERLRVWIDMPRANGLGSSNDGQIKYFNP